MTRRTWLGIGAALALTVTLAAPRIARAVRAWDAERQRAALRQAWASVRAGAEAVDVTGLSDPDADAQDPDAPDSAQIRALAMAAELGPRPASAVQAMLQVVRQEQLRWSGAVPLVSPSTAGTRTWRSLGPLAARNEYNGTYYKALDAGRPTAVVLDPGSADGLFLATSGGGLWWAPDANTNYPTWSPLTESLGSLAIGAVAVSPTVAGTVRTIYLGLGDAFDQKAGLVVKGTFDSSTGLTTWGPPVALAGVGVEGKPALAQDVRELVLDPNDANHVLVGTNVGLFESNDAGASFALRDLPNEATQGNVRESVWSIVYVGKTTATSKSIFLASGVYACPTVAGAAVATDPPLAGFGAAACGADTSRWNKGDLWRTTDGGGTWTSLRVAGTPFVNPGAKDPLGVRGFDLGRIALGAVPSGDGTTATVYAQAGNSNEAAPVTAWYLKSTDGGASWSIIGSGLTAQAGVTTPTSVTNKTLLATDCVDLNIGHAQSWYNLVVAVDPTNPDRVLFGGDLCSIVSKDGGATFANASHWLPQSGRGYTPGGFLPYVHADWHVGRAALFGGVVTLFVGTDGGLFVTRNIWDVPSPEVGSWLQPDVGLATHLFYGIGTGDPTLGNPNVVFGGLQDNGTRWRLLEDENFIFEFNPGNWDQILGGDGLGAAAVSDSAGQNAVYWISVNGSRRFCRPRAWDCSQATRLENGIETANWRNPGAAAADPFLIRYDTLDDDSSAVASASNTSAYLWTVNPVSNLASIRTVVAPNSIVVNGIARTIRGMGLRVSPYRYTIDGVPNSRIYGGVTTSGANSAGSFLVVDKPGIGASLVSAVNSLRVTNVAGAPGTGTVWIGNGSDFAAPRSPATLGGTDPKQTWLVSSNSVLSNAVGCADPASPTCDPAIFIPASVGHLFKTTDAGNTWVPFHGNGTSDLPNLPVYVIRFDPTDDSTIYVGTEAGVYRTTDAGQTWARYGQGLPAVRVTDIRISRNGSVVRVSTYGRGVWEIFPRSEAPPGPGDGDYDRNGTVDFFDLASLAARTGSTPSATSNLVYDSLVDLDGNSTLDDADLSALLAKFGGTP